jgi:hypothetical protein
VLAGLGAGVGSGSSTGLAGSDSPAAWVGGVGSNPSGARAVIVARSSTRELERLAWKGKLHANEIVKPTRSTRAINTRLVLLSMPAFICEIISSNCRRPDPSTKFPYYSVNLREVKTPNPLNKCMMLYFDIMSMNSLKSAQVLSLNLIP